MIIGTNKKYIVIGIYNLVVNIGQQICLRIINHLYIEAYTYTILWGYDLTLYFNKAVPKDNKDACKIVQYARSWII